jgi:hypothetical protein
MAKLGYWNGYSAGMVHGRDLGTSGIETVREHYERALAILREEILNLKEDRNNQAARADAACDLLLQHLGARAISRLGVENECKQVENTRRFVSQVEMDPTEDLPLGTPGSLYRDANGANIAGLSMVQEPAED